MEFGAELKEIKDQYALFINGRKRGHIHKKRDPECIHINYNEGELVKIYKLKKKKEFVFAYGDHEIQGELVYPLENQK